MNNKVVITDIGSTNLIINKTMRDKREKVLVLLQKYETARDSYKELYILYKKEFYPNLDWETYIRTVSQADIQRTCAYIQNTLGEFTPSIEVQMERFKRSKLFKTEFAFNGKPVDFNVGQVKLTWFEMVKENIKLLFKIK